MDTPLKKGYNKPIRVQYNFFVLSIVGLVLQVISFIGFQGINYAIQYGTFPTEIRGEIRSDTFFPMVGGLLGILIVMVIIHEGVHGLFFWLFRYRPSFGLVPPFFAYAIASGQYIRRRNYFFISLAPLVLLDVVFFALLYLQIPTLSTVAVTFLVLNTSGAVGDLWMAIDIVRRPTGTLYFDASPTENYVYEPKNESSS